MPRFDGTGPRGMGPMTGWGIGPCACGFRRGFGRRYRAYGSADYEPVELTKEEQARILEAELKDLETEKQFIEKKLDELKK